jgi:hypothetical protein
VVRLKDVSLMIDDGAELYEYLVFYGAITRVYLRIEDEDRT